MSRLDVASLLLRATLGAFIFVHGANKWRSSSSRAGTAAWFASIGMRAPRLQAATAAFTEMSAGLMLIVGFLVPSASAAVLATMIVAIVVAHRGRGFFIFNESQGWEYCGFLAVTAVAVAGLGGGRLSLDEAFEINYGGTWGFATAAILGSVGAVLQLAAFYRPNAVRSSQEI